MRHGLLDLRIVPALLLAVVVAFALFLLMHSMISSNQNPNVNAEQVNLINFVQVQHNEQVQTKNYNHPPPPPPPKRPPPKEQIQTNTNVSHHVQQLPVNVKFDTSSMGGSGVYINPNAGENRGSYAPLTPMVRIKPQYPPQAQYQGVQGTVEYVFHGRTRWFGCESLRDPRQFSASASNACECRAADHSAVEVLSAKS